MQSWVCFSFHSLTCLSFWLRALLQVIDTLHNELNLVKGSSLLPKTHKDFITWSSRAEDLGEALPNLTPAQIFDLHFRLAFSLHRILPKLYQEPNRIVYLSMNHKQGSMADLPPHWLHPFAGCCHMTLKMCILLHKLFTYSNSDEKPVCTGSLHNLALNIFNATMGLMRKCTPLTRRLWCIFETLQSTVYLFIPPPAFSRRSISKAC